MATMDEILYGFPIGHHADVEDVMPNFWSSNNNMSSLTSAAVSAATYNDNNNNLLEPTNSTSLSSFINNNDGNGANNNFFSAITLAPFSPPALTPWRSSMLQQPAAATTAVNHHHQLSAAVTGKSGHMSLSSSSENHQPMIAPSSYQQISLAVKHPVVQVPEIQQATGELFYSGNNLAEFFATTTAHRPPAEFFHENYYHHQTAPPSSFLETRQHVPFSASWLEPPPAPGDAEWTRFGPSKITSRRSLRSSTAGHHHNGSRRRGSPGRSRLLPPFGGMMSSLIDDDTRSDSGDGNARQAANIRERRRMKLLNEAFGRLRGHVPQDFFSEHKRSKLTVLRAAIRYIKLLSDTLVARGCSGKANASLNGGTNAGQISRSRQQLQPQSVVVTSPSLNTRHRVSWRIVNSAAATIGRLSPASLDDAACSSSWPEKYYQPIFQDVRLRYVTWRPSGKVEAEAS